MGLGHFNVGKSTYWWGPSCEVCGANAIHHGYGSKLRKFAEIHSFCDVHAKEFSEKWTKLERKRKLEKIQNYVE